MTGLRKPRRPSNKAPGRGSERERQLAWLERAVTAVWIALLLFVVGYATAKGEMALVDLDQLDLLTTYSMAP